MVLDQFGNLDNPLGHYKTTGPEVWEQTSGRITHFVSSMGTTGASNAIHQDGHKSFMLSNDVLMHMVHSAPLLTDTSGNAGTIMGVSRYLKEKNPDIQIVGLQPAEGASIAGIRRWPKQYLPKIFQVDGHPQ